MSLYNGEIIACSKIITIHSLESRQPIHFYNPHKGSINCVNINHTNKVIASCGHDGRIVLVNAQKPDNEVFETNFNSQKQKQSSINACMFSPHSNYIAAGSSDSLIKVWDLKNNNQKNTYATIKSHVGSVSSLAWIRNTNQQKSVGQILASASTIGDIFLHSIKTTNIVQTYNSPSQQSINQIKISQSQSHCRLAACTNSGSVIVWDLKNNNKQSSRICHFNNGKKTPVSSLSFSSFTPVLLATASVDQTLTFYDIHEKKAVKVIPSQQPLTSINFHSDGHTLVVGGMQGGLYIYDLRKPNKAKEKLIGHQSAIKHTQFIKEYQPSNSTTMSNSRSSKASISSINSKPGSSKDIQQKPQQKLQIKKNNFVQPVQTIRAITNNQGPVKKVEEIKQTQISSTKISSYGQEAIKNSMTNNISNNTFKANGSSSSSNQPYQPVLLPKPSSNQQNINVPIQTVQINNNLYPQSKQGYMQQTSSIQPQILPNQIQKNIKNYIGEHFESLNLQIVHQFHLQQMQIKEMIQTMVIKDKQKDQKIRQLQNQIKKLRGNTY